MENVIEGIRRGTPQPTLTKAWPIDTDELRMAIGIRLRGIRLQRGATQKTVADATGMHMSHLCRVESGKASLDIRQAIALAAAYQMEVGELLGVDDE